MERSYVYDDQGRVIRQLMRMGDFKQDETITYNEHGDVKAAVCAERSRLEESGLSLGEFNTAEHSASSFAI